ncbi:MAG: glycerophosphodiester phosphodiesterase [Candidatus Hodarchaeota archaeon]
MKEKEKKVIIIGHRGANSVAPENTLKSFQKAIDLGADYIEFDIHMSKDGEIVVMHDSNTFAITGHKGLINRMTIEELKRLDCGDGEQIPTLRETIKLAKGKIGLQIEIKAKDLVDRMVEILREEDLIATSLISSFQHAELLKVKKIEPKLKVATLEPTITGWSNDWSYLGGIINKAIRYNSYAIHPRYQLVTKQFIDFAHNNDLKINIWTLNSKATMKKFIKMGVDGIITDDISKAKEILKQI